jgi:zinc transport system ATP-binding protein
MPPLIQISNLTFAFDQQTVLRDVNLDVEAGTTLGLIGPNGGGKTTLIRLLMDVLEPTSGSIRIGGLTPRQAIRRGDVVGYLPQKSSATRDTFPISVRQAVHLGLAGKAGMLRSFIGEDVSFADRMIERVGLSDVADRPIGALSGGQLQRAYIARALAPRPKLLLLDEPTTGIDRPGQERFIEFLQGLKNELGLTVVFVSHDLRAVSSISDRIACLNQTLHYHDVPDRIPADLVYRMFACDLEAMGIKGGHMCTHAETCTEAVTAAELPRITSLTPITTAK